MSELKVSIVIPTMNRSDFLRRSLYYYAKSKYKGWIYIGDSSESSHIKRTKETVRELEDRLKIKYFAFPQLNDSQCIKSLLEAVETPYVAFVADDDLLVPSGMDKCVAFLVVLCL